MWSRGNWGGGGVYIYMFRGADKWSLIATESKPQLPCLKSLGGGRRQTGHVLVLLILQSLNNSELQVRSCEFGAFFLQLYIESSAEFS